MKVFTDPGAVNESIAAYSDNNPDALINTVPKYLAIGIAGVTLAGGVFIFLAALIAVAQ